MTKLFLTLAILAGPSTFAFADPASAPSVPNLDNSPLKNAPAGPAGEGPGNDAANPATGGAIVTNHDAAMLNHGNRESSGGNVNSAPANSPGEVREAQRALVSRGYGIAEDGVAGPETSKALRNFQAQKGLPQSGELDQATLEALGVTATVTLPKAEEEPSGL